MPDVELDDHKIASDLSSRQIRIGQSHAVKVPEAPIEAVAMPEKLDRKLEYSTTFENDVREEQDKAGCLCDTLVTT